MRLEEVVVVGGRKRGCGATLDVGSERGEDGFRPHFPGGTTVPRSGASLAGHHQKTLFVRNYSGLSAVWCSIIINPMLGSKA